MTNKDRSKQDYEKESRKSSGGGNADNNADYRSTNLRDSRMMAHLLDALENGQDIGHYGRLTFVMVARHFLSEEEIIDLLNKQPDADEKESRIMLRQVQERGYNPPKRERILQWMEQQDFPICPDTSDPNECNVYRELQFPEEIYNQIEEFWEEKVEAEDQE